jgi:hypothetical protein
LPEGLALGADSLGVAVGLALAVGSTIGSAAAELAQKDAATTVSDTRAAEMPFAVRLLMPLLVLTR